MAAMSLCRQQLLRRHPAEPERVELRDDLHEAGRHLAALQRQRHLPSCACQGARPCHELSPVSLALPFRHPCFSTSAPACTCSML